MKFNKVAGALVLSAGLAFSFSAHNVFAQQPNVDLIDVSHYNAAQGEPLSFYQTLKASGVKGAVVKVSEGTYYVDPAASVNIANARQAGMVVSAYHFARFNSNSSAANEADWFDKKLQLVGFDKKNDGYVVLDIEDNSLTTNSTALTEYTNSFVAEMKRLGYSKIDIYSGSYYYNSRLQPRNLTIDKPWLAGYPANPQTNQPTVNFSNGRGAWQWASDHVFIGMSNFGRFDVSEDYAGKYTNAVRNSAPNVGTIGNISLLDYMKSKGMDASFAARTNLAAQYGIVGYTGSAAQNLALLSKLQNGIQPAKLNTDNSRLNTSQPAPRPVTSPVVSSSVSKASTYTVRSGDSLSKIAVAHGTTVSALAALNGIKNVNLIRAGQVLKLSGSAPVTVSSIAYHTVVRGDTVSALSKRYGSSIASIKSWNKLNSKYTIYLNQRLRVR